jgi:hypothetical protein
MAGLLDLPYSKTIKALYLGESGSWKTGSLAALVCEGYKLRILDIDKGTKVLLSLLTDEHYPYAKLIKSRNIDLNEAVDAVPIDLDIGLKEVDAIDPNNPKGLRLKKRTWAPLSAKGWEKAAEILFRWNDGIDRGRLVDWDDKTVLVIDTFAKLATGAYYFNQAINGRLGDLDGGNMWRQDIGGAQSQLRRLLQLFYDSRIKCNILINTHITPVDDSRGFVESPGQVAFEQRTPHTKGLPMAIGRAMAKEIGTFFNDLYVAKEEHGSANIYTTPTSGISTKRSVWLEREYPSSTGLAEIFAAHRKEQPPLELIETVRPGSKPVAPQPEEKKGNGRTTIPRPLSSRPKPLNPGGPM